MSSTDTEVSTEPMPADQAASPASPITLGALFGGPSGSAAPKASPWHPRGADPRHEKRIGMAPRGTRRSMGKR